MNRTHRITLTDMGTMVEHATVHYLDRGPERGRWRPTCTSCKWRGDTTDTPGASVDAAFHHGLSACTKCRAKEGRSLCL